MILDSNQMKKTIDWLLTNGSAPIKYLTHKHVMGTPGSSEVRRRLWCDVGESACVQEIFGKQEENGSWHTGGSWARGPSYTVKGGIDSTVAKYRFYHLIENDWLAYHMTRTAANMAKHSITQGSE